MTMLMSPDGCSKAVARRAALTPSADVRLCDNIARGMGATSVNPQQATSAVGRGPNPSEIGESMLTIIGNLHEIDDANGTKTSDGPRSKGHRGTKRVPVYDDQGNLTGIKRVTIEGNHRRDGHKGLEEDKTSDVRMSTEHRGNRANQSRMTGDQRTQDDRRGNGKTSDGLDI